jgi:FkbM family methyltransferase
MFAQTFIENQYGFPHPPPATIVDAGANIGTASLYFALRFPRARIIALEPEPSNYAMLCRNVENFPQIVPLQAALWSYSGTLRLSVDGAKSEVQVRECQSGVSEGEVRSLSMPDLISECHIESIDMLKIDIEGAEKEIFANADPWIERVRLIVIELHERIAPGCTRAFYSATRGFAGEFRSGENIVVTRKESVPLQSTEPSS